MIPLPDGKSAQNQIEMTTLKEARKDPGKMKLFIKEHRNDAPGDEDKMNDFICSSVRDRSKSAQGTSFRDSGGN